jgi:hypothetical protein
MGKTAALDAAVFHLALQAHTRQQQQLPSAGHSTNAKAYGHLHEEDLFYDLSRPRRPEEVTAVSSRNVFEKISWYIAAAKQSDPLTPLTGCSGKHVEMRGRNLAPCGS